MLKRVTYADLAALPSLDEIKARKAAAKAASLAPPSQEGTTITTPVITTPVVMGAHAPSTMKDGDAAIQKSVRPYNVHRCCLAQDGHSRSEQLIYDILWKSGKPEPLDDTFRFARISMNELAEIPALRMTQKNLRIALQRLVEKLSIEEAQAFNPKAKSARVWKVFSYKSILERRRLAGMEWVVRDRGVRFVDKTTPVITTPVVIGADITTPVITTKTTPVITGQTTGVVMRPHTLLGLNIREEHKETTSSSFPCVTAAFLAALGRADDNAVARIVTACRAVVPDATEEEISHFLRTEAARFYKNPRIHNLSGLMITQVPKCFEGESFRLFREAQHQVKEAAQREQQESERRYQELQDEQRRILEDPNSSEEDKHFARSFLDLEEESKS
jgi:hypothetical protein